MTTKTIGILVTGHTPPELAVSHGDYAVMFSQLLGNFDFAFQPYYVVDGQFPDDVRHADGWLLTGSKFGVYEDHAWIRKLEDFIRAAHAAEVPMVGICFGHQAMAKALGGRVEKFSGGWGAGTTRYWRADKGEEHILLAWHQDQVIEKPEEAEVIGSNEHCAHAVLRYGDWGLSYQPHPEFTPTFFEGLAEARKAMLPEAQFERAKKVELPLSTGVIADEIGAFLARAR